MFLFYVSIGAMAVKKKLKKIRQDKQSSELFSKPIIKSEPIDVIEIFDD